jgi:WD40 repeat protein
LVTASNDGFLKVFNLKENNLMTTIKGIFGSPLCLDVSHDRNLLAAGYEDDTFLLYSMYFGAGNSAFITPLCRG